MRVSIKIALAYAALSVLWTSWLSAFFSRIFPNALLLTGRYKDWPFIAFTALLLFATLERHIRKRDSVEETLRAGAAYDPLTGLLNRTCFIDNLGKAVACAKRKAGEVGVIFLDLDGFKHVNDRYGHHAGDEILTVAAARLRDTVRGGDSVARFGGDEFLVLVDGGRDGTERLAKRLVEVMREPFSVRGDGVALTASVGFALYPYDGEHEEQLVRAADAAMYRAKGAGKDLVIAATNAPTLTRSLPG